MSENLFKKLIFVILVSLNCITYSEILQMFRRFPEIDTIFEKSLSQTHFYTTLTIQLRPKSSLTLSTVVRTELSIFKLTQFGQPKRVGKNGQNFRHLPTLSTRWWKSGASRGGKQTFTHIFPTSIDPLTNDGLRMSRSLAV